MLCAYGYTPVSKPSLTLDLATASFIINREEGDLYPFEREAHSRYRISSYQSPMFGIPVLLRIYLRP